jgi:hypothetical protein
VLTSIGSALRRRYEHARRRAGLRPLRFHDLRHTFGTRMIAKADILRVKEWMGHADVQTTMRYLHYAPRPGDARLVDEAFAVDGPAELRAHDREAQTPVAGIEAMSPRVAGGEAQASRTSVSHASRLQR